MFERFTERARNVMVLAQEEARRMSHNYIGTEHLLLGLIREEEGVAAQALRAVGVSFDEARERVGNIVGYGEEDSGGQAPFTPRSKKVLELSLREALQLGHDYIGTEHILLGLVRESEGVAAMVLSDMGVDPDDVSGEIVELLGGGRATRSSTRGPVGEPYLARVTGIEVEARFGLSEEERAESRQLRVDIEYTHGNLDVESPGRDPSSMAEEAARTLEQRPFGGLVEGAERVGHYVLMSLPEARRVVVTLSDPQTPPGRGDSAGVSLTGTFRQ